MILNRQELVPVNVRTLEQFLARASKLLRLPRDAAAVCLVTDAKIAAWNRAYRGKAKPTDVLSFSTSERAASRNGRQARRAQPRRLRELDYFGDIAIAPSVARRNARLSGRRFDAEMQALILHGLLHLMGYDHETDNGAMERLELRLRRKLRIA